MPINSLHDRGHGLVILYIGVNNYLELYTKANQLMIYCVIVVMDT